MLRLLFKIFSKRMSNNNNNKHLFLLENIFRSHVSKSFCVNEKTCWIETHLTNKMLFIATTATEKKKYVKVGRYFQFIPFIRFGIRCYMPNLCILLLLLLYKLTKCQINQLLV